MRRLTYLIALALLAMVVLAPNAGAQSQTVSIRDFNFSPPSISVTPGTTVTWTNQGQAPHTVTHTGGAFDSGTLQPGQSYSFTFKRAGSYAYFCRIHPFMRGTVVVGGGGGAAFFGSSATASPTATASPMAMASPTATASPTASTLAGTGGAPVVPAVTLAASLALVVSGLVAMRFVLRGDAS